MKPVGDLNLLNDSATDLGAAGKLRFLSIINETKRCQMRQIAFQNKSVWLKAVFFFLFFLVISHLTINYAFQVVRQLRQDCAIEKLEANLKNKNRNHTPTLELSIGIGDLPKLFNYRASDIFIPEGLLSSIDPIEYSMSSYSIMGSSSQNQLHHDVYWFNTPAYAYCRFDQMTSWDNIFIPENFAVKAKGPGRNRNIYGEDAINCYGYRIDNQDVGCYWVGYYGEYVTTISARIGGDAFTPEELDLIIEMLDQKMNTVLDKPPSP